MDLLEIYESKNIGSSQYEAIAFDETCNYIYLLNKKNNYIDKFDFDLTFINTINLSENLDFLCFSNKHNCFFGMKIGKGIKIIKLDKKFNVDCSHLVKCDFIPTNFKFCKKTNSFYLSNENNVLKLNSINFEVIEKVKLNIKNYNFNTIYDKHFICSSNELNFPKISIFNNEKLILENNFKHNTKIIDILCNSNTLLILAKKNSFTFIYKATLNLKCLNNFKNKNKKYEKEINYDFSKANYISKLYADEVNMGKLENSKLEKKINIVEEPCETKNKKDCDSFHKKCHKNNCNTPICDTEISFCEILHSIALVETGIAHILNSEGEKIQKALQCTCDIKEILKVNKSITETIVKITKLEETLCCKLEALSKNNFNI